MPTVTGKSSFTADGVAYARTFTDIPLSAEIYARLVQHSPTEMPVAERHLFVEHAPFFEARFLICDRLFQQIPARQVLEAGAGFGIDGILLTADPSRVHVELDLPEMSEAKRQLVSELIYKGVIAARPNLFFEAGNVLNHEDVRRAALHLAREPVIFFCAGLLRYISLEDQERLFAESVLPLLRRFGGYILTTDIELVAAVNSTVASRESYDDRAKRLGYDVRLNLYRDIEHARSFFGRYGRVAEHSLFEAKGELVSPRRAGIDEEAVNDLLNRMPDIFVVSVEQEQG